MADTPDKNETLQIRRLCKRKRKRRVCPCMYCRQWICLTCICPCRIAARKQKAMVKHGWN